MARHMLRSFGSLILAFMLLTASLVAPGTTNTQAQGGSRTFPETGKTVSGKFLQYWDGHGGLAQQGFPISEQIQERSDTDGKIYTLQYFERAVFEHHPENAGKPSEVLLSLLGTFLYKQKYKDGAPNQTPNTAAGSRLFAETGQRLGGRFLQYWNSQGGLAQQGFPISNEFQEKSELNGQTYTVQYFERAVFEYHPENKAPFDVLLSQLGTFRNKAKYGALTRQLSGTGNSPKVTINLKAGLAVLHSVRAANDGYFYIDLMNPKEEDLGTIGYGSGPRELSAPVNIPADGTYVLDVSAEGGWTINVSQPTATFASPPPSQRFANVGPQATPLFSLKAGTATVHIASANNQSKEAFRASLRDSIGNWVGDIINTEGPGDATAKIEVPEDGIYIIGVQVEGDWTLEITQ